MQADFSVELGGDAPALEIPWRSNDPCVQYYDLKKHPELVKKIPEATAYPELGAFLSRINAAEFPLATAKCDAWSSSEVAPEEEIFGDRKFVSYVDLIFVDERERCSFAKHEAFAKELCRLLDQAPEIAATVELVIRHCYYHQQKVVSENEARQGGTLSENVKNYRMSSPENEGAFDHGGQADVTRCSESTDCAFQDESARVTNSGMDEAVIQDEPARLSDDEQLSEMHHIELYKVTDQNEQVIGPKHGDFAALSEGKQSGPQEAERSDLLCGDDSFKTSPSDKTRSGKIEQLGETESSGEKERSGEAGRWDKTGFSGKTQRSSKTGRPENSRPAPHEESGNVQLETKLHYDESNSSVTGFCLTAYVTSFGDCDHDPLRRWAIGLNLLQHAIVQLNSNLQLKL
ncbi:MAG TPA: hypothetical protein VGK21_11730 [Candidatus Angelobacter sp.]